MKLLHSKTVVAFVLAGLILPTFALGQENAGQNSQGAVSGNVMFCAKVNELTDKINTKVAEREQKLRSLWDGRNERLLKRKTEIDDRRTGNRDGWDEKRVEFYAKLDTKATTDTQKTAVTKFKSEVDAAVSERRASVDSAVNTYRSGLNAAIAERKNSVENILANVKKANASAVEKAKADCAAGINPKTVRDNFLTSTKSTRDEMKQALTNLEKRKDTVKNLSEQKNTSIKQAVEKFRESLKKSQADLRNALGN